jgi:hypothetical protein
MLNSGLRVDAQYYFQLKGKKNGKQTYSKNRVSWCGAAVETRKEHQEYESCIKATAFIFQETAPGGATPPLHTICQSVLKRLFAIA